MTAPTTRETADHAELARLAEAASAHLAGPNLNTDGFGLHIWGDSLKGGRTHVLDVRGWGYLTGGGHGALGLSEDDGIAAQRAIQAYVVAAWNAVPTLLSEIAALRGEVERWNSAYEIAHDQATANGSAARQAERQRDEASWVIEKLLEANSRTSYPADHPIHAARRSAAAFLANQGADQ